MLTSFAYIMLLGMLFGWGFKKIRLPGLLGMLLTGMLLGPYALNLLDESVLAGALTGIPVSIVLGLAAGILIGQVMAAFFRKVHIRDSGKVLILLSISFLLVAAEQRFKAVVPFSGLFVLVGVACCLWKTGFTGKERIFCMAAYMPKATVQAAIGGLPLSMGLSCGNIVLTTAILAILITAPAGAFLIDRIYETCLTKS